MAISFIQRYQSLVAEGVIEPDAAQETAAADFAALEERVMTHRLARKSSSLGWLFGRGENKRPPLKGLYIHGDVGRGKTMLMDLFFAASVIERKRRAHFHEFMVDVHDRVHGFRQRIARGELAGSDPIRLTADALFDDAWLLCFDEFHVTDIADAMILGRLFSRLFELGAVVVATSNVAPEDLYKGGLNRALFLPFLARLAEQMEVLKLDARTDFRLEKLCAMKMWHCPSGPAKDAELDRVWECLTGGEEEPRELAVKGRWLLAPRTAQGGARFAFHELCGRPLGAEDYLRLAREFHTLVIDRIPVMDHARRNEARRFIFLIDALYDNAVKLVASADAEPGDLYRAADGFEAAEFKRTASRLVEMASQSYLALPHGGRKDSTASGSTEGLVET
jgi:cell division protein ZapE